MPFSEANGHVRAGSLEDSQLFFSTYLYLSIYLSIYIYIFLYVSHFHTVFRDKSLVLEKKFFGGFPQLLVYTYVSQSPALLSNRAVASEKVLYRVLTVRYLCLRVGCLGHPTVLLYICLRVSYCLLRQMAGSLDLLSLPSRFPRFSLGQRAVASEEIIWSTTVLTFVFQSPSVV